MCEGIAEELAGIDLGDQRLNRRSVKIIEALAANPEASVNGAVEGWTDTHAAYRFFSNDNVTPEGILEPHFEATVCRMREHPVVLLVQDTTELDYSDHPAQGVRCLNRKQRLGMYLHVDLAVAPDRLPLGVTAVETFDRSPESLGTKSQRKAQPIEAKESGRWLRGMRRAAELAERCPDTQIVSVADREGDIYELFLDVQQSASRADYVIRLYENRSTPERNRAVSRRTYHKAFDALARSPRRATFEVDLPATPKRKARRALLEIRAQTITLKPPNDRPKLPTVTLNMVLAQEVGGPGDGTDVCWRLGTTLPIDTLEQVLLVVAYYQARWVVETYFRTIKSGCRVEEIQLETKDRLLKCLSMYLIIGWRILYLTHLNRVSGDLPCTAVFADHEWKPVWRVTTKTPLPPTPPRLDDFMRLLTRLGGYNNRPGEAPPGPQPVWIGLRRMLDLSSAWLAFGPESETCV